MLVDLARSPNPIRPHWSIYRHSICRSFHAATSTPGVVLLHPLPPVLLYDEPVDPKQELEERCKAPCTRPLKEYQACAKRIQGDESGHKHCTGQYFDYWRCVDKCVATKLFTYLK